MGARFNKATGCSPGSRLPRGLQWQHGSRTLAQTPAAVGRQTQTWSLAEQLRSLNNIMANQISTALGTAFGHLHGQGWQPSHWASLWPLAAIKVTVIHTGPGCGRTKDPYMALGSALPEHHHGCPWQAGCQHLPIPHHLYSFPSASLHST